MILLLCSLALAMEFDRVDGKSIHFKPSAEGETVPSPLKVGHDNPKVLGLLKPESGLPYVLYSEENSMHLLRADGTNKLEFVHPGRIVDPKTGSKVLEANAYFGKCLPKQNDVLVVFQSELIDRKRNKRKVRTTELSMFVAEPDKDGVGEKLSEVRSLATFNSRKNEALRRVKTKQCFEIEGRHRPVARNVINLRAKRELDEDDDDQLPREGDDPAAVAKDAADASPAASAVTEAKPAGR